MAERSNTQCWKNYKIFELVVAGVGTQRALFGFDGGHVSRRRPNDIQESKVPIFACFLSKILASKAGHRE